MDYESSSIEKPEDIERDPKGVVKRWVLELKLADKREGEWRKKAEKVWRRYRSQDVKKHSFNILWSNTETLRPAIYNSLPKPDVRRRFKDADPIGKAAAEVLSRSLEFGLDASDFDNQIRDCVLDMLLPGRGVARVRYVPSFEQVGVTAETHYEENEQHQDALGESGEGDTEELAWEQAPIEHVKWDDFRMGVGDEWQEIQWVGFRHKLTREQLEEQFGEEIGSRVPLDNTEDEDLNDKHNEDVQEMFKTAEVWEIWCKESRKVYFIAKSYKDEPLKTVDDPLKLTTFFPVPKPLYAFEDSASTVPIPLFEFYKEQADELDTVTRRINLLVKGLKMRGIYDSTLSELSEVMRGEDNDLIPASNVTALLERGGLEKAIWFMPIEQAAKVLGILQQQREATKQVIYEITGISDILRGSTNASETATAQQIKSQWGSMRLKRIQADVANFIRDLIRLQAEIIGEQFQPETLKSMTGLQYPMMAEKQQAMLQYQQQVMMAQQQGQQPPPPPQLPPSWEEIVQVIRDDKLRTFKIDVETDSTVAASVESDMKGMAEVLGAINQASQSLGGLVQAGALPIEALKEVLITITRRARMGSAVEDALDHMQPPKPPAQPQDNSLQVEQMRQQAEQAKSQAELQAQQQQAQIDAQLEQMKIQSQQALEQQRLDFEKWKVEYQEGMKFAIAEMGAKTSLKQSSMSINASKEQEGLTELDDEGTEQPTSALAGLVEAINQNMAALVSHQVQNHQMLIAEINKPRRKIVQRGPDGRATGTIEVSE